MKNAFHIKRDFPDTQTRTFGLPGFYTCEVESSAFETVKDIGSTLESAEDTAWHAVKITLRDPQPVKSWQLYKRNLKTDAVSLLHPDLTPMTETEARSCENAFAGTYQPAVHVFASLINPKWEA